jgi:hypothetical protein
MSRHVYDAKWQFRPLSWGKALPNCAQTFDQGRTQPLLLQAGRLWQIKKVFHLHAYQTLE